MDNAHENRPLAKAHPCISCGACCAYFRVSFHWSETLPGSFEIPEDRYEAGAPHLYVMKGTGNLEPRCDSLIGEVGQQVGCEIYSNRPSPCRDFKASFEDGAPNERCDKARAAKGLPALTVNDY